VHLTEKWSTLLKLSRLLPPAQSAVSHYFCSTPGISSALNELPWSNSSCWRHDSTITHGLLQMPLGVQLQVNSCTLASGHNLRWSPLVFCAHCHGMAGRPASQEDTISLMVPQGPSSPAALVASLPSK
jgi:hypothetical protein